MTKRFIEFATQSTDNGEINNGFHDIKTGEWYYTKDSENAKEICELLNELHDTNQELYDFRLVLNALLFNEWAENGKYEVYKSKRHSDGELCFEGEWFVVVAILPTGQVTNHYPIKDWDYFKIPAYDTVKDEFDGHTSIDVLIRYGLMLKWLKNDLQLY